MSSHRKISAILLLFSLLLLTAACNQGNTNLNHRQGNVRVVLTSAAASTAGSQAATAPKGATGAPGAVLGENHNGGGDHDVLPNLSQVNVTFSSLLARNLDGELIDLVIDLPQTVDLIGLINGQEVTLPMGTLPPGMYDQLVVVITQVEFVFVDGMKVALTPPGGGWTRIVPVQAFEVVDGQTITIELQFKPWQAFRELGGAFQFFPDFDCHRR